MPLSLTQSSLSFLFYVSFLLRYWELNLRLCTFWAGIIPLSYTSIVIITHLIEISFICNLQCAIPIPPSLWPCSNTNSFCLCELSSSGHTPRGSILLHNQAASLCYCLKWPVSDSLTVKACEKWMNSSGELSTSGEGVWLILYGAISMLNSFHRFPWRILSLWSSVSSPDFSWI